LLAAIQEANAIANISGSIVSVPHFQARANAPERARDPAKVPMLVIAG
jgi:hypothetical protein